MIFRFFNTLLFIRIVIRVQIGIFLVAFKRPVVRIGEREEGRWRGRFWRWWCRRRHFFTERHFRFINSHSITAANRAKPNLIYFGTLQWVSTVPIVEACFCWFYCTLPLSLYNIYMSFEVMSLQQDLSKSSADAPNHSAHKKVQTLMDSCAEKDAQREWQKRQNPQSVPPKKTNKPKQVQLSLTQKLIQCAQATTSVFYNHTPPRNHH